MRDEYSPITSHDLQHHVERTSFRYLAALSFPHSLATLGFIAPVTKLVFLLLSGVSKSLLIHQPGIQENLIDPVLQRKCMAPLAIRTHIYKTWHCMQLTFFSIMSVWNWVRTALGYSSAEDTWQSHTQQSLRHILLRILLLNY